MGLIDCASGQSAWYGYEYYKSKKVKSVVQISEEEYEGYVKGTEIYQTKININHPRQSLCNCPFANGHRVVCKHMMALYFSAFPQEAVKYKEKVDKQQEDYEKWQEELVERVKKYVMKMSKSELQDELLKILFDVDWVYDRFVRDHGIDE